MKRRKIWWPVYGVCAAGVFLALAWITVTALGLERAEYQSRAEAEREEAIRLALWRMDSQLSPMIAYEAARPYFEYATHYPPGPALASSSRSPLAADVTVLSPLVRFESEYFPLHFQIDADGRFASPQVPEGEVTRLFPASSLPDVATIESHRRSLGNLSARMGTGDLQKGIASAAEVLADLQETSVPVVASSSEQRQTKIQRKTQQEIQQRLMSNVATQAEIQKFRTNELLAFAGAGSVTTGPLAPVWISEQDETLVFVRTVRVGTTETMQGFLVDWPAVRDLLLGQVGDLFPGAELRPASMGTGADMLATVPAALHVDGPDLSAASAWSPVRTTLVVTWLAGLIAMGAVALTLRASIAYGDRRSRFASAVTHELRTPLTTFRMYSQMLADGTITDANRRQKYLETLEKESGRLAHLVENVLSYARVEDGRSRPRGKRITVHELIERNREALARRATDGGMDLRLNVDDAADLQLEIDPDAVGQILFNLVDNACKYGLPADDPAVELTATVTADHLELRVRDHGPGVPAAHRDAVFSPFHRGTLSPGDKTPGIGLGLALARGLARDLGGDLHLEDPPGSDPGAWFVLTLPPASPVVPAGAGCTSRKLGPR
jgi:signal transduction histidine kinase